MADDLQARAEINALEPREQLNLLVARLLDAVTYDVGQFWKPNGEFAFPRDIPKPLKVLMKGVKMRRSFASTDAMELVGISPMEVTEVRWTSQAELLMRAIETLTSALDRQQRKGDPLSDEEVERGALQFLAARRPDLAEKYPELFRERAPGER